jgi:hypothetical protein
MPEEHDDKPLLYRKRPAANKLQVGLTTLDKMIAAGDLDVVPLGKRAVGITVESIERVARQGVRRRTDAAA